MDAALEAAAAADFATSPNPMVGAVVARDGEIVATGFHRRAGEPHAEVEALRRAGERARGADLYVTLEPCSHRGRTPPCVDAVIAAGVRRCVVAMGDPNPLVDGRGTAALRAAGIEVEVGGARAGGPPPQPVLPHPRHHRAPLRHRQVRGVARRPDRHPHRRVALDHLARGAARGAPAAPRPRRDPRRRGHRARRRPRAHHRLPEGGGRSPLRVVVDSALRLPAAARLLAPAARRRSSPPPRAPPPERRARARGRPVPRWWTCPRGRPPGRLRALLEHLGARGCISLLAEGGAQPSTAPLRRRLVDRVVALVAPRVIGGVDAPGAVGGRGVDLLAAAAPLRDVEVARAGPDVMISGDCERAEAVRDGARRTV